jgi:glycosyltransferase involved in cell wall biosynthesis
MRYYCTYFDHHYLPRGLALYDSLCRHGRIFELWVLCLSEECEQALQKLKLLGVKTISMREFEAGDAPLQAAKQNRSQIEYFFTCTPSLPLFLFKINPVMDSVTYLDGDLYFFGDAEEIHAEIGEASIAITPHRFPPALRDSERYGIYNVGWITFRRDTNALACLEWWRERCLEWCYDREENGRFADQKYLDCWPSKFAGVKVIEHPGVNLAPWNLSGHQLEWENGRLWVDGRPLLVFHFHGLKQLTRRIFDPQLVRYQVKLGPVSKRRIYRPYLEHLIFTTNRLNIKRSVAGINPRVQDSTSSPSKPTWSGALQKRRQLRQSVLNETYLFCENFSTKPHPIGVVFPTYNCAGALKNHLAAMEDWLDLVQEIVVVDSHSEDGSLEMIQERIRHPGLRIFSRPRGLYQSWNFGISQITSKYTYISTVGDLITRDGIKHLVETAERLDSDVVVSPPRFASTEGKNISSVRWPIHHIISNMQMPAPCLLSKFSVFVLAVDYALNHGLQGILGSSASNIYRTEVLQRFPFPTDCGSPGDVVWGVRHARDLAFAVTPVCFSEFLFHEKEYTMNTRQQNALIMENLAKEARAILIHEVEGDNHEARMFFDWLQASEEYNRARKTLEEYRSRPWPWYLCPAAWRARSQKRLGRKQIASLQGRIEPFFSDGMAWTLETVFGCSSNRSE